MKNGKESTARTLLAPPHLIVLLDLQPGTHVGGVLPLSRPPQYPNQTSRSPFLSIGIHMEFPLNLPVESGPEYLWLDRHVRYPSW